MYQSPPTLPPDSAWQVPHDHAEAGQLERLVVQWQDGALQLQRDVPLLRKLRGKHGTSGIGAVRETLHGLSCQHGLTRGQPSFTKRDPCEASMSRYRPNSRG